MSATRKIKRRRKGRRSKPRKRQTNLIEMERELERAREDLAHADQVMTELGYNPEDHPRRQELHAELKELERAVEALRNTGQSNGR